MTSNYQIGIHQKQLKALQIAKLKRLQEEERLARWRENPMIWLKERLGEDPKNLQWSLHEGYDSHNWDGTKDPFKKIFEYASKFNSGVVQSGTGTGKTFTIARLVLWFLDCYPRNGLVVTTAPTEKQLKNQAWKEISAIFEKFRKIRPYASKNQLSINLDNRRGYEDCSKAVAFTTGHGANAESATSAQGYHAEYMLIILEETPGIHISIVKAFTNTLKGSTNNLIAFGNPDSPDDTISHLIETFPSYKKVRISGYDHPNVVTGREIIKGAVSQSDIDRALEGAKGDMEHFDVRSRIRGLTPTESSESLIKRSWVQRQIVNSGDDLSEVLDDSANAVGVDVARSEGGDKACTVWGKGNVVTRIDEFQCGDPSHLAFNLVYDAVEFTKVEREKDIRVNIVDYNIPTIDSMDIYNGCIGVDAVGVGGGTIDVLRMLGYDSISIQGHQKKEHIPVDKKGEPLYEFVSFRAQLMYELYIDIKDSNIWFVIDDADLMKRFIKELTTIRYKRSSQKIAMEGKEDIKKRIGKSPNILDAVAYWNWTRKYGEVKDSVYIDPIF